MPDALDENGLTIKTLAEIIADIENGMKAIYGDDISVASDSPDGQMINLFSQACIDLRELLSDIYSSLDPAQAAGVVLDQRVAINGVMRNPGTYTVVPESITVDRAVSLVGLDDEPAATAIPAGVYTIKDDAGTQFALIASVNLTTGTTVCNFRAVDIGAVEVAVGTITTPVTVIAGVTAITNLSGATTQGVDEETDAALRIRRQKSIANVSTGYLDSIEGNLLDVDGVSEAVVYENVTATTDGDSIPPHSIWAIVAGGADADIGQVLYAKKTAGAGFKGTEEVDILRANGSTYTVKFDRPSDESLWISFALDLPGGVIDTSAVKASIVENVSWAVGSDALADVITSYVKGLNPLYRITAMGVSDDNITYVEVLAAATKASRFIMSTARITIS
jgi:uncharacterized phage protein gp47/JayE